jgi:HD-like signal output (HDOD) protein
MQVLTDEKLEQAQKIVKKVELPSQPTIVLEINKEMGSESPNFKKIADLVGQDAALTAKVINVINSPFFGVSRKVDSISQALTLMGVKNFFKIILTTALREAISGDGSSEIFWFHSIKTAVAAEHIASGLRAVLSTDDISPDMAYLAGLFHDCAIPILAKRSADYLKYAQYFISHKVNISHAEEKMISSDHCVIGHLMAKSWSISDAVCKAILYHHEKNLEAHDGIPIKLVALLKMADYLAYTHEFTIAGVDVVIKNEWEIEEWAATNQSALYSLSLDVEDLRDYRSDLEEKFSAGR